MKVRLTARGIELSADLRDQFTRRIHFSLGRFAGRVRSVSVRLAGINGAPDGLDKCCDIGVDTGLSQKVIVRERQETIHAAVALAMDRVEREVERKLARRARPALRGLFSRLDLEKGNETTNGTGTDANGVRRS